MRKTISLMLLIVMVLACVGFTACGVGEVTPPSSGGTTPTPSDGGTPTPAPSSGGGFTWNDMPIYPGATQGGEVAWSMPPEEGEWQKAEWRWYETSASPSQVIAFYQSAMPQNGWQQMASMEVEEVSWLMYMKNNEQDGAMVWVGAEEGKTYIGLMRGGE